MTAPDSTDARFRAARSAVLSARGWKPANHCTDVAAANDIARAVIAALDALPADSPAPSAPDTITLPRDMAWWPYSIYQAALERWRENSTTEAMWEAIVATHDRLATFAASPALNTPPRTREQAAPSDSCMERAARETAAKILDHHLPDILVGETPRLADDIAAAICDAHKAAHDRQAALEIARWKQAEQDLSAAYVRLRAMIPGALDTPHAPSHEQVWRTTEEALARLALSSIARTSGDPGTREEADAALRKLGEMMR